MTTAREPPRQFTSKTALQNPKRLDPPWGACRQASSAERADLRLRLGRRRLIALGLHGNRDDGTLQASPGSEALALQ